ncbi:MULTISPECIES: hypothetical protein [Sphingobacterium]|nr:MULTISPECIES: hypothetical protein [Sphingobacterium]
MEDLMNNPALKEGEMTRKIENETAKLPSKFYLCLGISAMIGAAVLKCCKRNHDALFVGQWVAPFLLFGIYNKIVKTEGHD